MAMKHSDRRHQLKRAGHHASTAPAPSARPSRTRHDRPVAGRSGRGQRLAERAREGRHSRRSAGRSMKVCGVVLTWCLALNASVSSFVRSGWSSHRIAVRRSSSHSGLEAIRANVPRHHHSVEVGGLAGGDRSMFHACPLRLKRVASPLAPVPWYGVKHGRSDHWRACARRRGGGRDGALLPAQGPGRRAAARGRHSPVRSPRRRRASASSSARRRRVSPWPRSPS